MIGVIKAVWNADGDRNVGPLIFDQLVAGEADVALGHFDQRQRQRLDQHVC
jgi:hypothetical protein